MALTKEAIKKLRAVKRAILAEPELYDQRIFGDAEDPCGTACCIAGWLVWNDDSERFVRLVEDFGDFIQAAYEVLGMPDNGGAFFGTGAAWPEPFCTELYAARTVQQRAKVAAARIEHFIATGGA